MFEHHSQPLLPRRKWLARMAHFLGIAFAILALSLITGILGYHFLGMLNWVDSLLEASMILAGMGPVSAMQNDAVKFFASFYALLSGCVFLTSAGIVMAPALHRLMHHFHQTSKDQKLP